MTNFEKWKEKLKPDAFLYGLWSGLGCNKCPVAYRCETFNKYIRTHSPKDYDELGGVNCKPTFLAWADAEAEEETKYIVRCEGDVGSSCIFCSFWNGRRFEKGEENAKVFDRRESAEEELNQFGYSPSDYSILTIQAKTTEQE